MRKRNKVPWIAASIAVLLVGAGLLYGGYTIREQKSGEKQAQEVLDSMEVLIPGLGVETEASSSPGEDPLPILTVKDTNVVGCLEIPALDVMTPVLDKKDEKEYFATWKSGSPVKGKLRITGGRQDVFKKLAKANPGDRVIFTDTDGVVYVYEVTTQYHLKDWDKANNDLMLCYEVDDKTDFVVGCTSTFQ